MNPRQEFRQMRLARAVSHLGYLFITYFNEWRTTVWLFRRGQFTHTDMETLDVVVGTVNIDAGILHKMYLPSNLRCSLGVGFLHSKYMLFITKWPSLWITMTCGVLKYKSVTITKVWFLIEGSVVWFFISVGDIKVVRYLFVY